MKSATDLALQAYEARPHRAESLYELARHFRVNNMPHAALLFAARAMTIDYPKNDVLFVEDPVYRHGVRQEYAIAAYYEHQSRDIGREVCDGLALDRTVPAEVRNEARGNLYWYTQPLRDIAPSFTTRQIDFPEVVGWHAMNPSVTRLGDVMPCVLRMVNYWIDERGCYLMPDGESRIRTRNFLGHIDPDTLDWIPGLEVEANLGEPLYDAVLGLEDMRLFPYRGELWFSAAARQFNAEGWCEQILGLMHGNEVMAFRRMHPPLPRAHEKNWMPIVGRDGPSSFVYRCDPLTVLSTDGKLWQEDSRFAAENFSGSSQLIPFNSGYLAVVHEKIHNPTHGRVTDNQFRFAWFDGDLKLQKVSVRWWLNNKDKIEYVAGLCLHPDGKRLVMSYGMHDSEAWVATISADDVRVLLGSPGGTTLRSQRRTSGAPAGDLFPETADTEWVALAPKASWSTWPLRYNQPLLSIEQVDAATAELIARGLPQHRDDMWKNWDTWLALQACKDLPKDAMVMDAGGTRSSAFLRGLNGVARTNINLDEPGEYIVENGILYLRGDITDTKRGAASFDFVACLSVIEHGVDWRKFFDDMARILRPGGQLCLSFDYWESPIDCGNRMAFGAPVKIFEPLEVREMVYYAKGVGLTLAGDELDLRCRDKVVNWIGLDYTFLCLLFRRVQMNG